MNKLDTIVKVLEDKQAQDIVVIDMEQTHPFVDYYVICHAKNQRQLYALKENLVDELEKASFTIKKVEGVKESVWILVDLGDVIVHLFDESERALFNIEDLYKQHPQKVY